MSEKQENPTVPLVFEVGAALKLVECLDVAQKHGSLTMENFAQTLKGLINKRMEEIVQDPQEEAPEAAEEAAPEAESPAEEEASEEEAAE
jgi:hypothetical protein|tara:strand:+ start:2419 stop:2688 length:270 start_codon:yes stop_codon:yes gene_type:complete